MSLAMKIYRALISPNVRNFVRRAENFCEENAPTFHKKIFLPVKLFAKNTLSLILKFSMSRRKNTSVAANLWRLSAKENFAPLVSIVVPNFNHAPFLRQRLESIYNQTYKNFEVILLDDASTDDSREILSNFYKRHENNTRLIFNEKNSGGVFYQWRKGIEAARGDLVWIAESDDFCAENFLSELVTAFADDAIQLAFCRTDFIKDGQKVFTTEQYLIDLPDFDWTKNFAMTTAEFVERGLAIKNIIPNVSGVLFRKRENFPEHCLEMKLCGDWLFYLDAIKGGCVYYSPATTNFYRIHKNSTSLKIQKEPRYFLEHEKIAEFVAENYNVPAAVHEKHFQKLKEHFLDYYGGKNLRELEKLFDLKKILGVKRKPNILMGVFALTIGGGEVFPLILANELSRKGYPVTVLDFQMEKDLPDVRKKLKPTVPLIYLNKTGGLAELVENFKIDIIHTHHGFVEEATSYFTENNPRCLHVVTLHGMYEEAEKNYLHKLLERVKKSVDVFVYIADKNLVPFRENNFGREEIFYKIGNGLERSPINPVPRAELDIPDDSFVACVVSRAIPQKGWQAAVEAVKLANTNGRRIDLILVGAGEMYDKLKGNVSEFVHLVGFKSNVRDYLAAADVGLLPSEYAGESFPLLIIDSFFAERPVISSNIGEVVSMVEDAGIVFDLVDGKVPIEELAKILRGLADNPDAYKKLQSRVASVAEKFSIERVAEKYINLYEEKFS
ncbi:MAG: glycosyltransferase [Selenomonadaceae bacterium]|nr:glycosyltransferase [Selenomonadaceae bacterium]